MEKIRKVLLNNLPVNYDGTNFDEREKIIETLTQSIKEVINGMVPEEKVINSFNKSPKPDMLNDCEVRREGFNQCRQELLTRIEKEG